MNPKYFCQEALARTVALGVAGAVALTLVMSSTGSALPAAAAGVASTADAGVRAEASSADAKGTGVIDVQVDMPEGVPDVNVHVLVFKLNGDVWEPVRRSLAKASEAQRWNDLPAGRYRVGVESYVDYYNPVARVLPTFHPQAATVSEASDIVVREGAAAKVILAPVRSGSVAGRLVVPAGYDQASVTGSVSVVRYDGSVWRDYNDATIGKGGGFRIGGLVPGDIYRLVAGTARQDGLAAAWFPAASHEETATAFTVARGAAVTGVRLAAVPEGTARGTFVYPQELGAEELYVGAYQRHPDTGQWVKVTGTHVSNGESWSMKLAAGIYRFSVEAYPSDPMAQEPTLDLYGNLSQAPDVAVVAGKSVQVPTPTVPTGKISGRWEVRAADETEFFSRTRSIHLTRYDPARNLWNGVYTTAYSRTSDGTFEVGNLPPGEYRVEGGGDEMAQTVTLGPGEHRRDVVVPYRNWGTYGRHWARPVVVGEASDLYRSTYDPREIVMHRRGEDGRYREVMAYEPEMAGGVESLSHLVPGTYRMEVRMLQKESPHAAAPVGRDTLWSAFHGGATLEEAADIVLTAEDLNQEQPAYDEGTVYEFDLRRVAFPAPPTPSEVAGVPVVDISTHVATPNPAPTPPPAPVAKLKTIAMVKAPKVSGSVRAGRTLKVTKGVWRPAGATVSFQWQTKKGKKAGNVGRATKSKLRLTRALRTKQVRVRVTVKAEGHKVRTYYTKWSRKVA